MLVFGLIKEVLIENENQPLPESPQILTIKEIVVDENYTLSGMISINYIFGGVNSNNFYLFIYDNYTQAGHGSF